MISKDKFKNNSALIIPYIFKNNSMFLLDCIESVDIELSRIRNMSYLIINTWNPKSWELRKMDKQLKEEGVLYSIDIINGRSVYIIRIPENVKPYVSLIVNAYDFFKLGTNSAIQFWKEHTYNVLHRTNKAQVAQNEQPGLCCFIYL